LDRLELIRFLQVAQTISVHHGARAYLLGINALRAPKQQPTHRGLRVVATEPPRPAPGRQGQQARDDAGHRPGAARVLEACRGERTEGPLVLRPLTGNPIDRRDAYRMVTKIAKVAGIPRHISPHSLRHAAITNALDAGVPLRDAQILARHADPRTTERYDRARGNLDRHAVHFLTDYVAGV
jgi:integrase